MSQPTKCRDPLRCLIHRPKCEGRSWALAGRENLRRVVRRYEDKPCERMATARRGGLYLCATHARMWNDGLVAASGYTPDPVTRAELRRYGKEWPEAGNLLAARKGAR